MPKNQHDIEEIKTTLEIDEHLELQRKGWKLQRLGWIIIITISILAALGLFGDGFFSQKKLMQGSALLSYDRFHRHEARMPLAVELANSNGNATVTFASDYLKCFKIDGIVPEPKEVKTAGGQVHYVFDASGKTNIMFHLVPQQTGSINGFVKVNDKQFNITHFIFP